MAPSATPPAPRRSLLLLSNSRNPEGRFLEHALSAIDEWLGGARRVAFVPWAGVTITAESYTALVQRALQALGVTVAAMPPSADARPMVQDAEALLVGGGNTFQLLATAQRTGVLPGIRERAIAGMPYCGWSAGAVLACPTIATTNDMPIVWPHGLDALGLVGCQINAHFTDAHPPGFRGETRRERLAEYLAVNPQACVVGLPEGDWLRVRGASIWLAGPHEALCFRASGTEPLAPDTAVEQQLEAPTDG
jgi:dipeptidase E